MATLDRAAGARHADLAQALALGGLLAGASLSLARLYASGRWLLPTWLTMAAALGLAALLRRLGVGQALSLVLLAAGFLLVAAILLFPDTLVVVVPTRETLTAMHDAVGIALRGMVDEAAPVTPTREFVLLTCAGVWAVAVSADGLTFRARQPVLAVVPTLGLFIFPAVIRSSSPAWYTLWFLLGVAGVLLIEGRARLASWGRWVSNPRSRPAGRWLPAVTPASSTARRLVLAAGLLALLLPWVLPGYGRQPLLDYHTSKADQTSLTINQFVSLKSRLTAAADVPLFNVTGVQASYWRLQTLDRFNGVAFDSSAGTQDLQPFSGDLGLDVAPGAPAIRYTQTIRIEGLRADSIWLPAPPAPVSFSASSDVLQSPLGRGLALKGRYRRGFTYQVAALELDPQGKDLEGPQAYDGIEGLGRYLDTSAVPDRVRDIAQTATRGKTTPFQQALALQDWLRNPEVFRYNLNVPALSRGSDQLLRFLTVVHEGYCEQFATAMAVMARELGIPARVAIGFTPGVRVGDRFEVSTHDAHAWPELYFTGVGWVRFEPTPRGDGQAAIPEYTTPAGRETTAATTPTTTAGAPGSSAAPQNQTRKSTDQNESQPLGGSRRHRSPLARRPVQLGLALLLLVLAVPATKAARNLLARRRARNRPRDAVAEAYAELAAWAGDAGIGRGVAETPAAYASRLAGDYRDAAAPLSELTGLFVAAEYANGETSEEQAHEAQRLARAARSELAHRLGWRRRTLAALSWRSLAAPRELVRR